ncbi:NAD(+) kinase [Candidatus Hartigia pinicola]
MFKDKSIQKTHFQTIGIVGRPRYPYSLSAHELIYTWLLSKNYHPIIDKQVAKDLKLQNAHVGNLMEIGQKADLVIVVGGDGNMLSAARILSKYNNKVIGINRGNLGFLTDLDPDNALQQLSHVLNGEYYEEKRFLLESKVIRSNHKSRKSTALNEVVLHPGKIAHMIEFEVYIDECFAFSQRSDGLIISTPTGSTAYSLSAGGPILMPNLESIVLVPMFPHSLSSRPLVISSKSSIRMKFLRSNINYEVICDSQIMGPVQDGEEVIVRRSKKNLNLIHPKNYNYFNILSSKLGWSKKTF